MGNCQAAEAATVVIQHQGNKVERVYWSISAHEVMSSNPGHYVAHVIASTTDLKAHNGTTPARQLKLLRPGDTLLLGQVYRLISFEDVLKEFAAKKCVKLGKLLRESEGLVLDSKKLSAATPPSINAKPRISDKMEKESSYRLGSSSSSGQRSVGRHTGGGQWKPALHSIAEVGT